MLYCSYNTNRMNLVFLLLLFVNALVRICMYCVVEQRSNGEGADAAENRGDGGEVGAGADVVRDVAF